MSAVFHATGREYRYTSSSMGARPPMVDTGMFVPNMCEAKHLWFQTTAIVVLPCLDNAYTWCYGWSVEYMHHGLDLSPTSTLISLRTPYTGTKRDLITPSYSWGGVLDASHLYEALSNDERALRWFTPRRRPVCRNA